MPVYDYATTFTDLLQQKYAKELCSDALTQSNQQVKFINAQTIKLPRMTVTGYKDHTRTPGFNSGTLSNDWEPKKLEHDRDIEFFVDPMDIKGTKSTERPRIYKGRRCFCCVGGTNLVLFRLTLIQALFACLGTDDCTC